MRVGTWSEWHRMLGAVAGIYLIADRTSGRLYVGSASGAEGVLVDGPSM